MGYYSIRFWAIHSFIHRYLALPYLPPYRPTHLLGREKVFGVCSWAFIHSEHVVGNSNNNNNVVVVVDGLLIWKKGGIARIFAWSFNTHGVRGRGEGGFDNNHFHCGF